MIVPGHVYIEYCSVDSSFRNCFSLTFNKNSFLKRKDYDIVAGVPCSDCPYYYKVFYMSFIGASVPVQYIFLFL